MPKLDSRPKRQPIDGDLTMRQSVAARLERKLAGTEVHWLAGHASLETEEGKVYCFITRDGNLALKLPAACINPLLESGEAALLRMGKRTMREWLVVPEPESPAALKLLQEAKIYVESLPKGEGQRKPEAKKSTQKNSVAKKS